MTSLGIKGGVGPSRARRRRRWVRRPGPTRLGPLSSRNLDVESGASAADALGVTPARRIHRLAVAGLLGLALSACAINDGLDVGRVAPDLPIEAWVGAPAGGAQNVSGLRGRPVFLVFWSRDCSACNAEMPGVQELQETYGPEGLVVIGVHVPIHGGDDVTPAQLRDLLAKRGLTIPVAIDRWSESSASYEFGYLPHGAVIDRRGRIAWSGNLRLSSAEDAIRAELGSAAGVAFDLRPARLAQCSGESCAEDAGSR